MLSKEQSGKSMFYNEAILVYLTASTQYTSYGSEWWCGDLGRKKESHPLLLQCY